MKLFFTLLATLIIFIQITVNAQRLDGQWKGGFSENSSGYVGFGNNKTDYVLELECRGSKVTGYSYTYFSGEAKRYYTICKLRGTLDKATREIVVTEIERTKYNTPPDFRNCFQTHRLTYSKDSDDAETLSGTWEPAPNQTLGCGFGKTILTRRLMKRTFVPKRDDVATNRRGTPFRDLNTFSQPPLSLKPKTPAKTPLKKPAIKSDVAKNDIPGKDIMKPEKETPANIPSNVPQLKTTDKVLAPKKIFEERSKSLLKTIEIQADTFTVQLYDNGEIDGDSISVLYNGSVLVSHKKLSDKPITLSLTVDKSSGINELTMYAENMGTIPPNTALMIVTDGDKRYEVRITSDTEKNGTIAFVHKNW